MDFVEPGNPVSPKVVVATIVAPATLVVMQLLGQIGFIAAWPEPVQTALAALVTAGFTFAASYVKDDPLRVPLTSTDASP